MARGYAVKMGMGKFCSKKCSNTGKHNPMWKDKPNYDTVHVWINRHYGKADHCSFDSSHKSKGYEWANISGSNSRDINDYAQLCLKCHRHYDLIRRGYRIYETKEAAISKSKPIEIRRVLEWLN